MEGEHDCVCGNTIFQVIEDWYSWFRLFSCRRLATIVTRSILSFYTLNIANYSGASDWWFVLLFKFLFQPDRGSSPATPRVSSFRGPSLFFDWLTTRCHQWSSSDYLWNQGEHLKKKIMPFSYWWKYHTKGLWFFGPVKEYQEKDGSPNFYYLCVNEWTTKNAIRQVQRWP